MARATNAKEERIELRVRPQDKALLKKAAEAQGLSVSTYVVIRSLVAAHEDIEPSRRYTVSAKDHDLFLGLLDEPLRPNARLKAAARRYRSEVS